jgi:transmembrane sensor
MSYSQSRIIELIGKFQQDLLTPEETQELEAWKNTGGNSRIYEQLMDPAHLQAQIRGVYDYFGDTEPSLQKIMQSSPPAKEVRLRWRSMVAAAAILALIVSSILVYTIPSPKPAFSSKIAAETTNDIGPGGNYAKLRLGGGKIISLDRAGIGLLAQQGMTEIVKQKDGQVVYKPGGGSGMVIQNTLETPAGGQHEIILPDGSRVTLNSVSRLEFPSDFTGTDRTVSLSGEAYFEITKSKGKPFHVLVDGMDIQVTGTSFNVKAYKDEALIKSTLLEGSITFRDFPKSNQSIKVLPGQEVQVDIKSRQAKLVNDADLEAAVAWKNGIFMMNAATDIASVLKEISRWYGVEIQYVNGIPQGTLSGEISKKLSLSAVMKVLKASGVDLKLEGRKLLVTADP